jgi:hypothetical protein
MDNHISWCTHRRHPFGSSPAHRSAKLPTQPTRIRRLGHIGSAPGRNPRGATEPVRRRATNLGWKGRILASIPARPTTRAHAMQAPPQRAPTRVDQESERGTGRLADPWTRLRGRRQRRAALLAAYLDLHPAKQQGEKCKHCAAEGSITNLAQTVGYCRWASATCRSVGHKPVLQGGHQSGGVAALRRRAAAMLQCPWTCRMPMARLRRLAMALGGVAGAGRGASSAKVSRMWCSASTPQRPRP